METVETFKPFDGPVALVIRNASQALIAGLAEFFIEYARENNIPKSRIPLVLAITDAQEIATLDEDAMRRYGWVRSGPVDE